MRGQSVLRRTDLNHGYAVRRVVHDEVDDDPDAVRGDHAHQFDEVADGPESRINAEEVGECRSRRRVPCGRWGTKGISRERVTPRSVEVGGCGRSCRGCRRCRRRSNRRRSRCRRSRTPASSTTGHRVRAPHAFTARGVCSSAQWNSMTVMPFLYPLSRDTRHCPGDAPARESRRGAVVATMDL